MVEFNVLLPCDFENSGALLAPHLGGKYIPGSKKIAPPIS